ncbi:MAG: DUF2868 domain-containing protein [Helicobacteraceae bacterium]|nr:DUF2868 domain-containing protein [Helicobacteraceae bacterium]
MFNKPKVQLNEYLKLKYLLNDKSIEKKISVENIKAYWKHNNSTDIDKLLQYSEQNKQYVNMDKIDSLEKKVFLSLITIMSLMFIIGLSMGFSLLSHDDTSRVNVTSFFFIMIIIPFLFSTVSFFYSIKSKTNLSKWIEENIFMPISKILLNSSTIMPNDVVKSIVFVKFQQGSLALLTGTILALFMTLLAKYVIFGWESTIIDTSSLQSFINFISFPWIFCCPNAVPSLEVIQDSHYYLSSNIIDLEALKSNTALSDSWWKFLGMSLIIYGFIPRFILLYLSNKIYHNALVDNILNDKNANEILLLIDNISHVTTTELVNEEHKTKEDNNSIFETNKKTIPHSLDYIIGWSHTKEILELILKHKNITASHIEIAGGNVPIDKEDALIASIEGSIMIFVDSWEPPQKDFINFVSSILKNKDNSISIYPIGMADDNYKPESKNISIWKNKISTINSSNIGIYNV